MIPINNAAPTTEAIKPTTENASAVPNPKTLINHKPNADPNNPIIIFAISPMRRLVFIIILANHPTIPPNNHHNKIYIYKSS
jgi:hypothetical protein